MIFSGIIGNADGIVDVPDKPGFVYVCTNEGGIFQAENRTVPARRDLPVLVECGPSWLGPDLQILQIWHTSDHTSDIVVPCRYCGEIQQPTPSGHCPGCGAGMR
jgi:hypothetical protein